jgi:hypothetical protein
VAAEEARGCSSDEQRNQPGPNAPFVSRLNVTVATARSTDRDTDCAYSDVAHTSTSRVGFAVGWVDGCVDGTRDGSVDGEAEGLVDGAADGCVDG